ncbi:hypothetical protein GBK04_29145 [Cytophagaceae bacterium SJW1-29]|uniref:Uncharacterized protein n=1 Tax=Salmonirosea aquatica TaxID=2654236 RepID=A0A7C9FG27_9BACT|nr:hypothetical protein [Cytophagaceae bacterium SJW1-29]MPR37287.1 hypothetical protein [Cytophagaceae bacterium SJW1-29]
MQAKDVIQPVAVDPRTAIYHFKVHILNISPMIYRRFIIVGNTHLAELHHLIQPRWRTVDDGLGKSAFTRFSYLGIGLWNCL